MQHGSSNSTLRFPTGFLWGTATAAHQVEGQNANNNWHAWEEAGKTRHRSGLACDWWGGRWAEDLDRAASAGQNAHRFSVEWSRIQPEPDRWDDGALDRYRAMARGMRERGLQPLVTLHHFTDPLWLYRQGGWEGEEVLPLFERYVEKAVEALREYASLWCTINEPNVYALSAHLTGDFPALRTGMKVALKVLAHLLQGHARAYRVIHALQPEARVGYALHYRPMVAARPWFPLDVLVRNLQYSGVNMAFPSGISTGEMRTPLGRVKVPEAKGTQDYLGLNYYSVDTVAFDIARPRELFGRRYYPADSDFSANRFIANIPAGLYESVKWAARTYPGLPLYITENGIKDPEDRIRPRYLALHLHQLWRAVGASWPVKGYFHWTLVDNFEWERGWTQRFGLWGLDEKTQARVRRPSADLYAAVCRQNALSEEMVARFCPEVRERIFTG